MKILSFMVGRSDFDFGTLFSNFIPANYFVVFYVVVYIVSLYINVALKHMDDRSGYLMLAVLIGFFSVWPSLLDTLEYLTDMSFAELYTIDKVGSGAGFTIVQFLLMYCIGAMLGRTKSKTYSGAKLFTLWMIVTVLLLWEHCCLDASLACAYCNPLVIAQAVLIFLVFKQLPFRQNKMINKISGASFTVYLLHLSFFRYLRVEEVVSACLPVMLVGMLLSVLIIYFGSYIVYVLWHRIEKTVFGYLQRRLTLPVLTVTAPEEKQVRAN